MSLSPPVQEEVMGQPGNARAVPGELIGLEDEDMHNSMSIPYQTSSYRGVLFRSSTSRYESGRDIPSQTSCTTPKISQVQSQPSTTLAAKISERPGSWQEHEGARPSVDVDIDDGAVTDDDCPDPDEDEYIDRLVEDDDEAGLDYSTAGKPPTKHIGKAKGKAPPPKGPNATVLPREGRPKAHFRGTKKCLPLPTEADHVPWVAEESSRINAMYQDLKKIWAGMYEAYLIAKQDWLVADPSGTANKFEFNPRAFPDREVKDYEFNYKFLRAMGDTGLDSGEMFDAIMQGFSHKTLCALATIRERCLSSDSLNEIWEGIELDAAPKGHYQGVYLIRLVCMATYIGSTSITLANRVQQHKDAAGKVRSGRHTNRKPQLVAKEIAKAKSEQYFALCLFGDDMPRVVMLLAEVLMMVFFGTFTGHSPDTNPRNVLGCRLAKKLRSVLEWQYPGEHLNRSLPTNEQSHFKCREILRARCSYCGDSQFLQIQHNYIVRAMYFVHSDGPTICSRCACRSSGKQKGIGITGPLFDKRPHLCPWYVREELGLPEPACQHCGDDDPTQLHYDCKVDGFACKQCRTTYENRKHNAVRIPEHSWPPHRRRRLHCQKCNAPEGAPGMEVSVRYYGTPRVEMALCRACAGPDPRQLTQLHQFGMTKPQARAYRATLVATTNWPYQMYNQLGQLGGLPPPWTAAHGWDVRDGPRP